MEMEPWQFTVAIIALVVIGVSLLLTLLLLVVTVWFAYFRLLPWMNLHRDGEIPPIPMSVFPSRPPPSYTTHPPAGHATLDAAQELATSVSDALNEFYARATLRSGGATTHVVSPRSGLASGEVAAPPSGVYGGDSNRDVPPLHSSADAHVATDETASGDAQVPRLSANATHSSSTTASPEESSYASGPLLPPTSIDSTSD